MLLLGGIIAGGPWLQRGFFSSPPPPQIDSSKLAPRAAEALAVRMKEVQEHPRSGPAWGRLGMLLDAYDYDAQAQLCFVEAERREPANPRWPYFLSWLLQSQQPEESLTKLRRAVALCGNSPEMPRYRLAKLLAERGKWEDALAEANALLAAQPKFLPAVLLGALSSQAQGRYAEAVETARKCVSDVRTRKAAWSLIAVCQRQLGNAAAAEDAVSQAAKLPEDQWLEDAFLQEVTALRSDHRVLTLPAHQFLAEGRLAEAAPIVEQLIREFPEVGETWLVAGRYQILAGQLPSAVESLRRHIALEPLSSQGHFQLGTALLKQDKFLEAAAVFAQNAVIKPDFGPAFFNQAFCLARAGKRNEAVPLFQQVLRLNPEHFETYLLLGDLLIGMGRLKEAGDLISQAEVLRPGDNRLNLLRQKHQSASARAQ